MASRVAFCNNFPQATSYGGQSGGSRLSSARPSYRWKELATVQKGLEFENNDPRLNECQRVPSLGGSTSGAGGRRVRHRHLTTPGEVRLHVRERRSAMESPS